MRTIAILTFLFVFNFAQAQNTGAEKDTTRSEHFQLKETTTYTFNNEDFTFTPDLDRIRIKKLQDQEEIELGQLRKTTDDGLYIMTSTLDEDVSFGRFDSIGNFRTLRYDREIDSVLEDYYKLKRPGVLKDTMK